MSHRSPQDDNGANDVNVDEDPPELVGGPGDDSPHWLWALISNENRQGIEVWQHFEAERPPLGAYVRRARQVPHGDTGIRIVADPVALVGAALLSTSGSLAATRAARRARPEPKPPVPELSKASGAAPAEAAVGAPAAPMPLPSPQARTPDDAVIDQRSGLVPKDIFLRLARRGAFPSKKEGKRVTARWGDVKAALAPGQPNTKPGLRKAEPRNEARPDDGLDQLRRQVGLRVKGRK